MRFWDASAILPLLVNEPGTADMARRYEEDPDVMVWWATEVECASALARLERLSRLDSKQMGAVLRRLSLLKEGWHEVAPVSAVRELAARLLRVHPLRAADSLQLAAAILAAERATDTLPFVCLDNRLQEAAAREGFSVIGSVE